jgi:hypothetical protein
MKLKSRLELIISRFQIRHVIVMLRISGFPCVNLNILPPSGQSAIQNHTFTFCIIRSWSRKFLSSTNPEISLLCPQQPATGPRILKILNPDHNLTTYLFKSHFNIIQSPKRYFSYALCSDRLWAPLSLTFSRYRRSFQADKAVLLKQNTRPDLPSAAVKNEWCQSVLPSTSSCRGTL